MDQEPKVSRPNVGRVVEFTNGDIVVMEEAPESPAADGAGYTQGRRGMRIIKVVQGSANKGPRREQLGPLRAEAADAVDAGAGWALDGALYVGEPATAEVELLRRTAEPELRQTAVKLGGQD